MSQQDQSKNSVDFSNFGYLVEQQLATQASSFTWQAVSIETKTKVIIKELRFGSKNNSWQAYETQEQEIALLQQLEHPKIPQYLGSFETATSFCLVREYIIGESLTERSPQTSREVTSIAVGVLEVLCYLQQQATPVLHLNLSPDNIIRDRENQIYLIDFQLAQTSNCQSVSSAIALNRAEFIAPEQLNAPSTATDIYALGTTLQKAILLEPNLDFTQLDEGLQDWLTKASSPDLKVRYADAETALSALQASSWDEITVSMTDKTPLSNKAYGLGIGSLGVLGIAIAVGYQVSLRSQKSLIQMTVALMAMVIVYLTQSAAATIITNDRTEQKQATIFAVGIPLSLVVITGVIWGKGEAVEVSLATAIAQAATLITVLYSRLAQSPESATVRLIGVASAIVLGLVCGRLIF